MASRIVSVAEPVAKDFEKNHESVKIIGKIMALIKKQASAYT